VVWEFRQHLGLLAEYRFTHFSPDLHFNSGRLQTDLNTHYALFGLSLRF